MSKWRGDSGGETAMPLFRQPTKGSGIRLAAETRFYSLTGADFPFPKRAAQIKSTGGMPRPRFRLKENGFVDRDPTPLFVPYSVIHGDLTPVGDQFR